MPKQPHHHTPCLAPSVPSSRGEGLGLSALHTPTPASGDLGPPPAAAKEKNHSTSSFSPPKKKIKEVDIVNREIPLRISN